MVAKILLCVCAIVFCTCCSELGPQLVCDLKVCTGVEIPSQRNFKELLRMKPTMLFSFLVVEGLSNIKLRLVHAYGFGNLGSLCQGGGMVVQPEQIIEAKSCASCGGAQQLAADTDIDTVTTIQGA